MNSSEELWECLNGMPLFTKAARRLPLLAREAIVEHERFFKRDKTIRDESRLYFGALGRAVMCIFDLRDIEEAHKCIFDLVVHRSPKLSTEEKNAVDLVEECAKKFGLISRLYYEPITASEITAMAGMASHFSEEETTQENKTALVEASRILSLVE